MMLAIAAAIGAHRPFALAFRSDYSNMTLHIGRTTAYFRESPPIASARADCPLLFFSFFLFFYERDCVRRFGCDASDKLSCNARESFHRLSSSIHGCFNKQLKAFPFDALGSDASFQVTPVNTKAWTKIAFERDTTTATNA